MGSRVLFLIPLLAVCLMCGAEMTQSASQTLAGVSKQQVLAAAGQAIAEDGFDVDEYEPASGAMATAWQNSPRRSLRYEILVESAPTEIPKNAVTVTITASARDRQISGWSPEYPIVALASDLLEEIADRTGEATTKTTKRRQRPKCRNTDECPSGKHCVSGWCFAECASDDKCKEREKCDDRGRCIPVPRSPIPLISTPPHPPAISATPDAGPATGEVAK